MKLKQTSPLLALHLSLILVACGPSPTEPVKQPTGTPTATATPTAGGTTETPSPMPTGITPSGTPMTPAPTSNPASGSSATVTLPNGSKLVVSLGNRFLEAKGQTIQLQTSLVDAAGQALALNTLKLLFSSSRPQDIRVSDTGLITALVDQGFADITVIVDGTELKASQLVSVNAIDVASGGGGGGGTPQPSASPQEDLNVDVEFEGLGIGEFQINSYTSSRQRISDIAIDSDGDFVVAWQSYQDGSASGIFAQRYNSAGNPQGTEFRVNSQTSNMQRNPDIAMDNDGDFVITWDSSFQDGDGYGIYAKRYDSAGTALDVTEFKVNYHTTNSQSNPAIAMDSEGDFVITWQSYLQESYGGDSVHAQRYDSAGSAQGSEFKVNTYSTGSQNSPAIAMDEDGDFVVTWSDTGQDGSDNGIYARRYDSAGAALDISEFRVNTYTSDDQYSPAIAMDNNGDFVVTWSDNGQDGSGNGIYARAYNSAGTALNTSEFKVNYHTTNSQSNPAIAMDSDGDFVVTWHSYLRDGSYNGVYAQRFNALGTAQSSEFRANTFTSDSQQAPAVAMDNDGDFIITWESAGQDGSSEGVYGKRYNAAGQPQ